MIAMTYRHMVFTMNLIHGYHEPETRYTSTLLSVMPQMPWHHLPSMTGNVMERNGKVAISERRERLY